MEVEILVYERESLLPSVTPKRFIDGSLCRVAQGAPLACSGFAPEDAVGRRSYAGARAGMTRLQGAGKPVPWRPGAQHVRARRDVGS